jgi:glycosyltransferase involved in cell wall biosynthesis/predicted O-methyltransferase YrrM
MISVIIPVYNDDLRLEWVLQGLCHQTYSAFEVIVVNDGGEPATEQLAQFYGRYLDLKYCYLQPPCAEYRVAAARNYGTAHSAGEQLVFLDGDTVPDPDMLQTLAGEFRRDRILNPLRRELPMGEVRPFRPPLDYSWLRARSSPPPRLEAYRRGHTLAAWGYCYSVPAAPFCRIGGWDEAFVGWAHEDADMNIRLRKLGLEDHLIVDRGWCTHLNHPRRTPLLPRGGREMLAGSRNNPDPVRNGGPLVRPAARLPEPYHSVEPLAFDPQGWLDHSTREKLRELLAARAAHVVVELGSWLGLSTRFLAEQLPPNGKVYAVDTWLGSEEINRQAAMARRLPDLYQRFLSNVIHAGLTDRIVPVRMTTVEAAAALDVLPDLVFVDASHQEADVYADIMAWYPRLMPGGVLCGDDWNSYQSVRSGVERAAGELQRRVEHQGNCWWLA